MMAETCFQKHLQRVITSSAMKKVVVDSSVGRAVNLTSSGVSTLSIF